MQKFFEDILKSNITFILSFLISAGLIGGASFVFLDSAAELQKFSTAEVDMIENNSEVQLVSQMSDVFIAGWFRKDENRQKFTDTVSFLDKHISEQTLDENFVKDAMLWLKLSEIDLYQERGAIKGFVFTDELYQREQKATVEMYDLQIKMNGQIVEMIENWQSLKAEERGFNSKTFQATFYELLDKYSAMESLSISMMQDATVRKKRLDDDYQTTITQIETFQRRLRLAQAGITIGSIILVVSVGLGIYYYSTVGKSEKNRIKDNKKRKK